MEAAILALVFKILAEAGPKLYEYIKGELEGGADAEELRKKPLSLSIAFEGKQGDAVVVQTSIEDQMLDPNAD